MAAESKAAQEWEEGDGEYVAPELLRGFAPTPAADIYSLGATVYESLTGGALLPRLVKLQGKFSAQGFCSPDVAMAAAPA